MHKELFDKDKKTLIQYPARKTDTSYIIPDGVTTVSCGAFLDCNALTSVTIPDSVTTIDTYAFYGCDALKTIRFLGNALAINKRAFAEVNTRAYYPKGNSTWTDDVKQDYGGKITWKEWDQNGLVGGVGGDNIDDILSVKLSNLSLR